MKGCGRWLGQKLAIVRLAISRSRGQVRLRGEAIRRGSAPATTTLHSLLFTSSSLIAPAIRTRLGQTRRLLPISFVRFQIERRMLGRR